MGILSEKVNAERNQIRKIKTLIKKEIDVLYGAAYWADETLLTEKFLMETLEKLKKLNTEMQLHDSRLIKKELRDARKDG